MYFPRLMQRVLHRRQTRSATRRQQAKYIAPAGAMVENLENRVVLAAPATLSATITSITSSVDSDSTPEHVTVPQGTHADVVIGFDYVNGSTSQKTATTTIQHGAAVDLTNEQTVGANSSGSATATFDVSSLPAGTYTVKVTLGTAPSSDVDGGAVSITATVSITVVATGVDVSAADAVYDGAAYDGAIDVTTHPAGVAGSLSYTYYSADDLVNPLPGAPTNAGNYRVVVNFNPTDTSTTDYTPSSGYDDFTIAKANATVSVINYSGTYDGQSHTASVVITGVGGDGTLASNSVSQTNSGSNSTTASISGLQNYNDVSGTATINIIKATLSGFAATQSALNIAKQGALTFNISNISGLVNGESLATALAGVQVTLKMAKAGGGTNTYTFQPTVTVNLDGTVSVTYNMKSGTTAASELVADLIALDQADGVDSTSASNAAVSAIWVNMESQNYTFCDDATTKVF